MASENLVNTTLGNGCMSDQCEAINRNEIDNGDLMLFSLDIYLNKHQIKLNSTSVPHIDGLVQERRNSSAGVTSFLQ